MTINFIYIFFTILLLIIFFLDSAFVVPEKSIVVIERFGKFSKLAKAGLNFKLAFIETIKKQLNLQYLYHNVKLETKTKDDVFVDIHCSIQYRIIEEKAFEACYSLDDPVTQLESYVFDTIRAFAPKLILDKLFEEKDTIAQEVKESLDHVMSAFGIEISKTLITHIDPDKKVKHAMNEINAAQRDRIAAEHRAEAEKLVSIKGAEAQKESRKLQGEGVAEQRKAIIHGLRESLNELKNSAEGNGQITEQEAIKLLIVNQYFDTLKEIGSHSKTNAIFLNHNGYSLSDITGEKKESEQQDRKNLIEAILGAEIIKNDSNKH